MKGNVLTPIPAELYSAATDKVVASADGIYDYQIGKFQEEINNTFTSQINTFTSQINQLLVDKISVSLTANKRVHFANTQITLTATCGEAATSIEIKDGSTVLTTGSGTTLSYNVTPDSNKTYKAVFTISGLTKEATVSTTLVNKIYYGAGSTYSDAVTERTDPSTSPAGTYTIVNAANGNSIFFVVPSTMTINSAKYGETGFPLKSPVSLDNGYKYYESEYTYDSGTLKIILT